MSRKTVFKTDRKRFDGGNKKLNILFTAAVIFILVASCLYIMAKNDFNLKAAVGGDIETTTLAETETVKSVEKSDDYYLFWCTDTEGKNLKFMWIVRSRLPKMVLTVFTPDVQDMIEYEGQNYTYGDLYSIYTEEVFVKAIQDNYGVDFEAYIGASPEMFKQMVNYFGGITVTLDEQIEYKNDFTLILMKGDNVLKGELLYKYLLYTEVQGDEGKEARCNVFIDLSENIFTPKYAEKLDTIYSRIANGMTGNVTIMKYTELSEKMHYIFNTGYKSAKAVTTIDNLKK